MQRLLSTVVVLCSVAAPASALADTFDYSFASTDLNTTTFFTYDSPSLITASTTFTPLTCGGFGESCQNVTIDPPDKSILVSFTPGSSVNSIDFVNLPASFFTVGTHTNGGDTINITDVPIVSTTVTPEPSSLLLLSTGILGASGALRRRFRRT